MPNFLNNLLQSLRGRPGADMRFLCRHLLSERGEASQSALAQNIIRLYGAMNSQQRMQFFEMLTQEFSADPEAIRKAVERYQQAPGRATLAALSAAVEAPRQELFRRINTAPLGTQTLVTMREHLQDLEHAPEGRFAEIDGDLKHLFRSWFNRGFLRMERISWKTSALILEKLIQYESVHEIHGWPDLRRRLEADRRCFAFFHPALADEPIIFVEVALANGLGGELEPLLNIEAPVNPPEKTDTAIFYSINNCLKGLRGIPFGNFLTKQVVEDLAAEFPKIRTYGTLSPLPRFSQALAEGAEATEGEGFTRERITRLIGEDTEMLRKETGAREPVQALFRALEQPLAHRHVLAEPLERLAQAYLTLARHRGRLNDPVAEFHLANGARLERINVFGNLRAYGLRASYGVTVNYRYIPEDLEDNHEMFVQKGQIRVSSGLGRAQREVAQAWAADAERHAKREKAEDSATSVTP